MFLNFVDREQELGFLEARYSKGGFEFFVIYGRRRVGKTELIKRFIEDKPHIYFLCDKGGTARNAARFKRKVSEFLREPPIESNDLEEIFSNLARKMDDGTIIIFDEFSYLVEKDPAVPSIFQLIVDEILTKKDAVLMLCGSSMSMMERGVLSYRSPLYGRKTGHILLSTLGLRTLKWFYPKNDVVENVEFYSVLGGTPAYLTVFSDEKTIHGNIKDEILDKKGHLYEEVDFLLREEFREPDVYRAILEAIGSGGAKLVEIANMAGIRPGDINKYLKALLNLGIIKKESLVTQKKTKKTLYSMDDNLFSFWFTFCEPHKSDIAIGELGEIETRLKRDFNSYVGRRFEKLVRDEIVRYNMPFSPSRIGRWWGHYREDGERKEMEIDIVALNEKAGTILFGEVKWSNRPMGWDVADKLMKKAEMVRWHNNRRKEHYLVVSKTGFTKKCLERMENEKILHWNLKDMEKMRGPHAQ